MRHAVEVEAEGLYEAAVLAIAAFRKHNLTPAGLTQLELLGVPIANEQYRAPTTR